MSVPTSSKPEQRGTQSTSDSASSRYWSGEPSFGARLTGSLIDIYSDLDNGRDGAKAILQSSEHKPSIFSFATYKSFFTAVPSSIQLAGRSPEIIFFAAL